MKFMKRLTRFDARPWCEVSESWSTIWRIPLFIPGSEAGMLYDVDTPEVIIEAVPMGDADEIVTALNNAFNEGREFARQR